MTEYAVSTNLISWVPAASSESLFGWPQDGAEAELVDEMKPGDVLIPKLAQNPDYRRGGSQKGYVQHICQVLGTKYEDQLAAYQATVAGGAGAVPFVWLVTENRGDDNRFSGDPWSTVGIEIEELAHPISTSEFLRLRVTPVELARQFKATAGGGRHIQEVAEGTGDQILTIGQTPNRDAAALRKLLLIKAPDAGAADALLAELGQPLIQGDLVLLVDSDSIPGVFEASTNGALVPRPEREPIARDPVTLLDLFERAKERMTDGDSFRPGNAIRAGEDLSSFMDSAEQVTEVTEFAHFYDRFMILPRKVSLALEIAAREKPDAPSAPPEDHEDDEGGEELEQIVAESLHGLTISAVEKQLEDVKLPQEVLAEVVTAIRSGKHLLLSGPPGTGKTRLASAICQAVVGAGAYNTATATADWTTFDTIGGYIPKDAGALDFEPGIVLRSLQRGNWLVIDELNRADIDKAFGPLFTLLSGSSDSKDASDEVVLPFKKAERNVRIARAATIDGSTSQYVMTPNWRLIGTLNVRDKASLFQLSFAFLRRFAVVDVPLPDEATYRSLFDSWLDIAESGDTRWGDAAMALAFGPNPLGPAILKDIARFTSMGRTATETTTEDAPYASSDAAFLTATRLYAVPQYEGASKEAVDQLLQDLRGALGEVPDGPWSSLETAFERVRLT